MLKIRNIILFAVSTVMICATIFCTVLSRAGVPFPDIFEVGSPYSVFEGRYFTPMPALNAKTIEDGTFQDGFESWISDKAPFRSSLLVMNAGLQRLSIAPMAALMNYPCYPTYFDSEYIVMPSRGLVLAQTQKIYDENTAAAQEWADAISRLAAEHPSVSFVFEVLEDTYSSQYNPSHDLMTGVYTSEWIDENLLSRLSDDVISIYDAIESEDELESKWYKTEHHQRIGGALDSYNKIAEALALDVVDTQGEQAIYDKWYGSEARAGRILDYSNEMYDLPTDFSHLAVTLNGQPWQRGTREPAFNEAWQPSEFVVNGIVCNQYHSYYGMPMQEVVYENNGAHNGKTCLFIEQSYGVCIEPYIANNFEKTICVDPLNATAARSLGDYIDEFDVDVVIVELGSTWLYCVHSETINFLG